jgi:hypothetical protein
MVAYLCNKILVFEILRDFFIFQVGKADMVWREIRLLMIYRGNNSFPFSNIITSNTSFISDYYHYN